MTVASASVEMNRSFDFKRSNRVSHITLRALCVGILLGLFGCELSEDDTKPDRGSGGHTAASSSSSSESNSASSSSSSSSSGAGGGGGDDGAPSTHYPAFTPVMPSIVNSGGRTIKAPKIL